jgi:hypothetical protein
MQTILALIAAYLVFVTRTWAITRLVVLADVGLALLFDLTPLRIRFGIVETIALGATLLLWAANLLIDRKPQPAAAERSAEGASTAKDSP